MILLSQLIQRQGVPYVTSGPNVARGHWNIQCPFCGPHDPSYHMGIRLTDGAWACWRDQGHRGLRPHRLLRALFQWSWAEIDLVCGSSVVERDELSTVIQSLQTSCSPPVAAPSYPSLPSSFFPIRTFDTLSRMACQYLIHERGIDAQQLDTLAEQYELYYQVKGRWTQRIIFLVRDLEGQLVGWTGRTWNRDVAIRYRSTSREEGAPLSDCLFHLPQLWAAGQDGSGRILVVTEGPVDALKLDWVGQPLGIRATCLFGSTCSTQQHASLELLSEWYDQIVIALDNTNLAGTLQVGLAQFPQRAQVSLVPGRKDVGELSNRQIQAWCNQLQLLVRRQYG